MTDTRRRVKVYTLNEDRQWDDRGTGHVSSGYVERLKGMSLLVRAESDGEWGLSRWDPSLPPQQPWAPSLVVWGERASPRVHGGGPGLGAVAPAGEGGPPVPPALSELQS